MKQSEVARQNELARTKKMLEDWDKPLHPKGWTPKPIPKPISKKRGRPEKDTGE